MRRLGAPGACAPAQVPRSKAGKIGNCCAPVTEVEQDLCGAGVDPGHVQRMQQHGQRVLVLQDLLMRCAVLLHGQRAQQAPTCSVKDGNDASGHVGALQLPHAEKRCLYLSLQQVLRP